MNRMSKGGELSKLDDLAVDTVMNKLFKNYKTWCKFWKGGENIV